MSQRRKFTDFEKKTVYANGNGKCAICGKPIDFRDMTIDHKIPLSQGGTNEIKNLRPACWRCNQMKCDMDSAEFLRKISKIAWHGWKTEIKRLLAERI